MPQLSHLPARLVVGSPDDRHDRDQPDVEDFLSFLRRLQARVDLDEVLAAG